ncbi:RidA family protein [Palleronia sp. LCG004]|uniref:RidA family protein n=1 Tax=Palleronia sp. LCG004 TaxID=3079304 RepID=UPI0029433448|nr:RidA family protein [Palleronia sp. LCG004]WOI57483.1 RidA family protein [Palleronia sp. LCG004]
MTKSTAVAAEPGIKRIDSGIRMSQAVISGGQVHVAGQIAEDTTASITEQTRQVLGKIERLIAAAGAKKSDLIAVNVFLPNIVDFDAMNAVYDAWIDPAHPPARACVEARLADPDLRVEMTAIAVARV